MKFTNNLLQPTNRVRFIHYLPWPSKGISRYATPMVPEHIMPQQPHDAPKPSVHNTSTLKSHTNEVWVVEWSPKGTYIASGGRDCRAIIWKNNPVTEEFEVYRDYHHEDPVGVVAWSFDEATLLTSQHELIRVWNLEDDNIGRMLDGHQDTITAIRFIPDDTRFLSADIEGRVFIWNERFERVLSATPLTADGQPGRVWDCCIAPDSDFILFLTAPLLITVGDPSDVEIAQLNPKSGDVVPLGFCPISNGQVACCMSSNSQLGISYGGGRAHLINLKTRRIERTLIGGVQKRHVVRVTFGGCRDQFVVAGSEDSMLYLWDLRSTSTQPVVINGHENGTVNDVSWKPDSDDIFASCSDDNAVMVWKVVMV